MTPTIAPIAPIAPQTQTQIAPVVPHASVVQHASVVPHAIVVPHTSVVQHASFVPHALQAQTPIAPIAPIVPITNPTQIQTHPSAPIVPITPIAPIVPIVPTAPTITQQFNVTVSNFKKLQKVETTIKFLTRCLIEKVIPNTFLLPLKLQHLDPENTTKAKNTLNQTSITLLKLALKSRKTEVILLNKRYWDSWHILVNLSQGQTQDKVTTQLKNLENKITDKLTMKAQQKFSWLLHKKQMKPKHSNANAPMAPSAPNAPNTPGISNKSNEPNEPKKKKHRRFVKRSKWKRLQVKKNKEQITAIYNHSDLKLSDAMKSVLNRGLNFCVSPLTLNITNVLVEYRKYERSVKWVEFLLTKTLKTNLTKKRRGKKKFFQKKNQIYHQTRVQQ
jgi:hypothetical protein